MKSKLASLFAAPLFAFFAAAQAFAQNTTLPVSQLPTATAITGTEYVPIVQNGATRKTTVQSIFGALQPSNIPFIYSGTGALSTNVDFLLNHMPVSAEGFSGIDPTGQTDSRAGLQNAVNAAAGRPLNLGPGTFWVDDAIANIPSGQTIVCAGVGKTTILVKSTFNLGAQGVFVAAPGEPGPTIRDCHFSFQQPSPVVAVGSGSISGNVLTIGAMISGAVSVGDSLTASGIGTNEQIKIVAFGTGSGGVGTYTINTTKTLASTAISFGNRTPLIHYPPAMRIDAARFRLEGVKVSNSWQCLKSLSGGGAYIDIECNGFDNVNGAVQIENHADFDHNPRTHCWPFGATADLASLHLYEDQTGICLKLGNITGWHTGTLALFAQGAWLTSSSNQLVPYHFDSVEMDFSGSWLKTEAAKMQVSLVYNTVGADATVAPFQAVGPGKLSIQNLNGLTDQYKGSTLIASAGGQIDVYSGILNHVDPNSCAAEATGNSSAIRIYNVTAGVPAADRTKAYFCAGTDSWMVLANILPTNAVGHTGNLFAIATDTVFSSISNVPLNGWGYDLPFATSIGWYDLGAPKSITIPNISFTPTPGTFAPTINSWAGEYLRKGSRAKLHVEVNFSTGSYSGAAGALFFNNMGNPTPRASTETGCTLDDASNLTFSGVQFHPIITGGSVFIRAVNSAGPSSLFSPANIPSPTSNAALKFTCDYPTQ